VRVTVVLTSWRFFRRQEIKINAAQVSRTDVLLMRCLGHACEIYAITESLSNSLLGLFKADKLVLCRILANLRAVLNRDISVLIAWLKPA
jgi:hypothetical protein